MYKKVRIGWKTYYIRKLLPGHFINEDGGIPFSIFILKKDKTRFDILSDKLSIDSKLRSDKFKEIEDNLKLIKLICGKAIKDFDFDKFFSSHKYNHCVKVYNYIVKNSMSFYSEITVIKESQLELFDCLAQRYGGTPFDHLKTSLDEFMFNNIVRNYSVKKENQRKIIADRQFKQRTRK